jgi:hypothetical protein
MRTISYRWTLAFAQIVFATAALVYAPYEYKAGPHPIGDDAMLLGHRKVWPPPVLRTSYSLNFPVLTAVVPFRFWGYCSSREVVRYPGPPYFSFSVEDCMFLAGVFALWYWLGSRLDRRGQAANRVLRSKAARITLLTIGCLLALGIGTLAVFYIMLTDADRPFRQIGMAGLVWGVTLLWYSVRNLTSAFANVLRESPNRPTMTVAIRP